MSEHETSIVSPGYHGSLIAARCSCGWQGPDHDAYSDMGRVLSEIEAENHRQQRAS